MAKQRIPLALGLEVNPSRHPPAGNQELLNMRAEILRSDSKATVPIALFRNEGVVEWIDGLNSAVRGMHVMSDVLYVVAGNSLYSIDENASETVLGTPIGGGAGIAVDMADNGTELVIVAGGVGYVWNESTDTFATITDPDFATPAWVEFLDQFMVFGKADGSGFFLSALADATDYDALDVASAESSPDDIVMGKVVNRDLLLFGTDTLEIWYNAGLTDFPLERAPSGTVEIGCAAKASVAICDNAGTWLARYHGGLSVRRLEGRTPRRISTPSLDDLFDSFTKVDDAIGQSYTFGGHEFYVLIFPTEERTFCWDATTNLWHERSYEYPDDIISSFTPVKNLTVPPFSEDDWTGDDGFTVGGGVATFDGGYFMGLVNTIEGQGFVSADGVTFTTYEAPPGAAAGLQKMAWSGGFVLAGTANGNSTYTSSNGGQSWTEHEQDVTINVCRALTWVSELGLFIYGSAGASALFTSPDGENWTERAIPDEAITSFAYDSVGNVLVAMMSVDADDTDVLTSSDGATWATNDVSIDASKVVWAPELSLFVAVGDEAYTSPDGATWTDRNAGLATMEAIAWSGSVLCAVGLNASETSPDGINWTDHGDVPLGNWGGIAWSPKLGLFMATESTGAKVMTSPDGATWTERTLPDAVDALTDIAWIGGAALTAKTFTSNTVHFASPGSRYTATAEVDASTATFGGRVGLTWYDAEGAEISTTYADAYTVGTTGLEESTVTATATANTAGVAVAVQANGPAEFQNVTIAESIGVGAVEWRAAAIEFAYGKVFVGDGLAARIGYIDRDIHKEFDYPIPWVTTSSPITKDRRLITFHRVEIEIDAGRSTSDNPRVWLQWSDDDGRTWSKARPRSMGAAGKYKTRLSWIAGGSARSRIYRVFGDDPSPTGIVAAYLDIEMGA